MKLEDLKVEKSKEKDWQEIYEVMEDTKLSVWFFGGENHERFYHVRNPDTNEMICCFQLYIEKEVAILRSVGVRKNIQKKGIGKYIVNSLVIPLAKSLGIKRLYARGNAKGDFNTNGFWKKTFFTHIKVSEIIDKLFKDDMENTAKKYPPELFYPESAFYVNLEAIT